MLGRAWQENGQGTAIDEEMIKLTDEILRKLEKAIGKRPHMSYNEATELTCTDCKAHIGYRCDIEYGAIDAYCDDCVKKLIGDD